MSVDGESQRRVVVHTLKVDPEFFRALVSGEKRYELRRDDRGFSVGDYLELREWETADSVYTGRSVVRKITSILRNFPGLVDGYCVLSLIPRRLP